MNPEYLKQYDTPSYFMGNYWGDEQRCWDMNQLRYGDQLPAICYAFGYTSFGQVRDLFRFEGEGKSGEPFIGALEQLLKITQDHRFRVTRMPRSILDIGGGRGEVSIAFTHWPTVKEVQMIEPAQCASTLVSKTQEKFCIYWPFQLWNKELNIAKNLVDWSCVDTVIMTESIEHIEEEDFDKAYKDFIRPTLQRNKGLLIITNWVSFHPIEVLLPFHVRKIDDEFYDKPCEDGEVIVREGSHLVIKYGGNR